VRTSQKATDSPTIWQRLWNLLVRVTKMELRIYESIWRIIARKPRIPSDAVGFKYHRPVLTVLIVLIILSAIEIPIIDAIVHRWTPIRIGFLILGIWGVTWMLGLLFAFFTRPHVVGPNGIIVREGLEVELQISWQDIQSVSFFEQRSGRVSGEPKTPKVFREDDKSVMAIRVSDETNLEITLERPLELSLPGLRPKGGAHTCNIVRFWADDPRSLLEEVREHIG